MTSHRIIGFIAGGLLLALPLGEPVRAATISGRVTNAAGQGLANVDLDFINVATGNGESASGDLTNATGNYVTTLGKLGVYDVYYTPLLGARYGGKIASSINLNSNQTVNITLPDAWFVSGAVVRGDTGQPAVGIDLDFKDLRTGLKIYTPHDNTDLAGHYNVAVPYGIYEVTFEGPPRDLPADPPQLASGHLLEVSVTGASDFALPSLTLPRGFVLTGSLLDFKGDGIINADIDVVVAAGGAPVFTQHDNTDSNGDYAFVVPGGVFHIEYDPPAGALQPGMRKLNRSINADTNMGVDVILDGVVLSGNVKDPDGFPLRQVDLDIVPAAGGAPLPTQFDKTDAAGHFSVIVPTGTYSVLFSSQVNSLVNPFTRTPVALSGNLALTDTVLPWHQTDGDTAPDAHDNCPFVANSSQADADLDGIGDACDNCSALANARQENNDGDPAGNACDPDDDNDALPDATDADDDGDGVLDGTDNCPSLRNTNQLNRDADTVGDACDPDDNEVEDLRAFGAAGFTWRTETGAVTWQVYRQPSEWLSRINYGDAFRDDLRARVFLDAEVPAPGRAFLYLVTSKTATVEGSLGRRSDAVERPNLRPSP